MLKKFFYVKNCKYLTMAIFRRIPTQYFKNKCNHMWHLSYHEFLEHTCRPRCVNIILPKEQNSKQASKLRSIAMMTSFANRLPIFFVAFCYFFAAKMIQIFRFSSSKKINQLGIWNKKLTWLSSNSRQWSGFLFKVPQSNALSQHRM